MDAFERKIMNWLANGDTGLSSETIAYTMLGVEYEESSHPWDPSDFNRCLGLLKAVPEIQPRLHEMSGVSPVWAALVDRWRDIEKTFVDEVGEGWAERGKRAEKTYALMKGVIEEGMKQVEKEPFDPEDDPMNPWFRL